MVFLAIAGFTTNRHRKEDQRSDVGSLRNVLIFERKVIFFNEDNIQLIRNTV